VEDQASDRAHRIGQERPVTIYRLVLKGTLEAKIVSLHARKRDLADRLLEDTGGAVRLDAAELLRLLRG
jgi:SNF2 family DNA or RNA helicase